MIYADLTEVLLSYNELGFLKEIKDMNGTSGIETDVLGRVISSTDYKGNRVLFEYEDDKKKSMTYPDGKKLRYKYDDNGLLVSIMLVDGEIIKNIGTKTEKDESVDGITKLVEYTYDAMARPLSKLMSNGQETSYAYNTIGRVSSIIHKLNDKEETYNYEYDLAGNKTSTIKSRDNVLDSGRFTYGYDALNQLISVSKDNNLLREYTYDAFGNRTSKKSYGDMTEESIYNYNRNNQLVKEVVSDKITKLYDYDKRGNLISVSENDNVIAKYTYNANNRVNSIVNYKDSIKESVEYAYNGIGQRIAQTVKMPERLEKKIEYVIDITKQYNNMLSDLESNYYYDNNVLALDREEKLNFYMQDDLGSVMGITDSNSNVIDEYMYDEFGEELDNISHIQTITYTGYQKEAVGDTYFAQARQYNPVHGRFVSEDIIKGDRLFPSSLNPYVYCYNKPEDFVDVDGRTACNAGITRVVETYLDDSTYKLPEEYTLGDAAKNYVYNGDGKIGTSGLALDTASEGVEHTIKYSTPKVLDSNVGSSFSKLGGKANVAFAIGGGVVDGYNEIEESLANGESADEAIINGTVETGFSIGTSLAAGALGAEFGAAVGTIFPGIGNIIGAVVGFVLGIAFSIVFDYLLNIEIYDGKNIKDLTKDLVKDIWSGYKKQLYEKQVMINNLYGISCDCPIMEEIYE